MLRCRKSVLLRRFANYLCKSVLPATLFPDCGGRCASVASLSTKLVFMVANFSIGEILKTFWQCRCVVSDTEAWLGLTHWHVLHLSLFICQAMVPSTIFRIHLPSLQACEDTSVPIQLLQDMRWSRTRRDNRARQSLKDRTCQGGDLARGRGVQFSTIDSGLSNVRGRLVRSVLSRVTDHCAGGTLILLVCLQIEKARCLPWVTNRTATAASTAANTANISARISPVVTSQRIKGRQIYLNSTKL